MSDPGGDDPLAIGEADLEAALEAVHQRANAVEEDHPCSPFFATGLIEGAEDLVRVLYEQADADNPPV